MSRQRKSNEKQLEFDYSRGTRQEWLVRMIIPSFTYLNSRGRAVTVTDTSTMNTLLLVLEDRGGGFPPGQDDPGVALTLPRIALDIGTRPRKKGKVATFETINTATASRAIAACESKSARLLKVERSFYKHKASRYTINWDRVKEVILGHSETEHLIDKDDPVRAIIQARAALAEGVSHETPDSIVEGGQSHPPQVGDHPSQIAVHPPQIAVDPSQFGVHPPQIAVDDTLYPRTRGLNHGFNHERNQLRNHDSGSPQTSNVDPTEGVDYSAYCGWPHRIERHHLEDCFRIQILWEYAVRKGFGGMLNSPDFRLRFFALCYVAHEPATKNPGGYLTGTLKKIADRCGRADVDGAGWPTSEEARSYAIRATTKVDSAREALKSGKLTREAERLLSLYQQTIHRRSAE